jgi:hypothetical protein
VDYSNCNVMVKKGHYQFKDKANLLKEYDF